MKIVKNSIQERARDCSWSIFFGQDGSGEGAKMIFLTAKTSAADIKIWNSKYASESYDASITYPLSICLLIHAMRITPCSSKLISSVIIHHNLTKRCDELHVTRIEAYSSHASVFAYW